MSRFFDFIVIGGGAAGMSVDLSGYEGGHFMSVQRNACDFCIAFYLGEYLAQNPKAECVILSGDKKGFDPLVQHLTAERGLDVRRVGAQKEAFPEENAPTRGNPFERLTALLKKEKALPRKRKGLEG